MDDDTLLIVGLAVVGYFVFFNKPAAAAASPGQVTNGGGGGTAGAGAQPAPGTGTAPRGVRNNNPGNIVATSIAWLGKNGNDGKFEKFDTAAHGIRALVLNLLAKAKKGKPTVASIITQWAPPSENNTAQYIAFVASAMGVTAGATLAIRNPATLLAFAKAIITEENGYNPYTDATIAAAVAAALASSGA